MNSQTTGWIDARFDEDRATPPAVVVVTPDRRVFDILHAAIEKTDSACDIVHAFEPSGLSPEQSGPVALYCLQCDSNADRARTALAEIAGPDGAPPVILVDTGDAGLDLDAALDAGAWDLVALAFPQRLEAHLKQGVRAGAGQLALAERLNVAQRRDANTAGSGDPVDLRLHIDNGSDAPPSKPTRRAALDGRMALHARLAQDADPGNDRIAGLVFVAVDDIEMLQDRLGLADSDRLLQEIGPFLLQHMQSNDRCFRFGAGEYVVLVARPSAAAVAAFGQRLHRAFSDELFGDDRNSATLAATLTCTVLAGEAADHDLRLKQIVDIAYEKRRDGGNAFVDCTEATKDDTHDSTTREWEPRLRDALAHDRFSLAYQGITSLAGDSQPYFDVLLRYVDDQGTLVRAGEFMAAAEQADLMPEIDRWVTGKALDVIAEQGARDSHIAMFIKLSATTVTEDDDFLRWLEGAIEQHRVPRHQLIFSFRENDVRAQTSAARQLALALDSLGFRVALTHYGSTAKAEQILDQIPAAFIKLAPEFARQILDSQSDERLARIIASARERQIPLIAEQIENANSMANLWQAGVNYVQGHFIQEPDTDALAHSAERSI